MHWMFSYCLQNVWKKTFAFIAWLAVHFQPHAFISNVDTVCLKCPVFPLFLILLICFIDSTVPELHFLRLTNNFDENIKGQVFKSTLSTSIEYYRVPIPQTLVMGLWQMQVKTL